jgi:hypothetical protein
MNRQFAQGTAVELYIGTQRGNLNVWETEQVTVPATVSDPGEQYWLELLLTEHPEAWSSRPIAFVGVFGILEET